MCVLATARTHTASQVSDLQNVVQSIRTLRRIYERLSRTPREAAVAVALYNASQAVPQFSSTHRNVRILNLPQFAATTQYSLFHSLKTSHCSSYSRDSTVGTAIRLRAGRSENHRQIPGRGKGFFFSPVQSCGAHQASSSVGTRSSSSEGKAAGT